MYWLLFPIIGIIIPCIFSGLCIDSDKKIDWKLFTGYIIVLLINLFVLFWGIYESQQKAIRDFEAGKYRKEITYKMVQKDSLMVPIDSIITYKPIKDEEI